MNDRKTTEDYAAEYDFRSGKLRERIVVSLEELKKSKVVFKGKELKLLSNWPWTYSLELGTGCIEIYSTEDKGREWKGYYRSATGAAVDTESICNGTPQEAANELEEILVALAQEFRLLGF